MLKKINRSGAPSKKPKDDGNENSAVVDKAKLDAEQKEREVKIIQGFVIDRLKEQNPALTRRVQLIDSQLELIN